MCAVGVPQGSGLCPSFRCAGHEPQESEPQPVPTVRSVGSGRWVEWCADRPADPVPPPPDGLLLVLVWFSDNGTGAGRCWEGCGAHTTERFSGGVAAGVLSVRERKNRCESRFLRGLRPTKVTPKVTSLSA